MYTWYCCFLNFDIQSRLVKLVSNISILLWKLLHFCVQGGRDVAKIGVLTAASGQPISVGRAYVSTFESYGASAYWIPIYDGNKNAAMDKDVVKNVKQMTGFFFGGGMQQKYIAKYDSFY